MFRRSITAALTLFACFVLVLVSPSASAATSTFRDVATLHCLDSNTSGNVYAIGCNGGNFQNWIFAGSDTTTTVRDVSTLFCLDSNTNGNVYTLRCNGGNFQKWRVERSAHRVVDVATGRCLDSNTANSVYTLPCNGGNFQNWLHN